MQLTSTHNPLLLKVRRAAKTGRLTDDGLVVAEGPHLLMELAGSPWRIEQVLVTAESRERHGELLSGAKWEVTTVSPEAFATVSATEMPQGILTLARPVAWKWRDLLAGSPPLLVVLDQIQDPGNAGAIIRSAEAFGAGGVVLTEGCARVSNGKVLRASAGSVFRLPFLEQRPRAEILHELHVARVTLYALAAQGASSLEDDANLTRPCAILVGNEGAGLAPEFLAPSTVISIPTGRVESLNAAVACSLVLYEAFRQRRRKDPS